MKILIQPQWEDHGLSSDPEADSVWEMGKVHSNPGGKSNGTVQLLCFLAGKTTHLHLERRGI